MHAENGVNGAMVSVENGAMVSVGENGANGAMVSVANGAMVSVGANGADVPKKATRLYSRRVRRQA